MAEVDELPREQAVCQSLTVRISTLFPGVSVHPCTVKSIVDLATMTLCREVRSYMGLAMRHRRLRRRCDEHQVVRLA